MDGRTRTGKRRLDPSASRSCARARRERGRQAVTDEQPPAPSARDAYYASPGVSRGSGLLRATAGGLLGLRCPHSELDGWDRLRAAPSLVLTAAAAGWVREVAPRDARG